jgi:hypothetical protein
MLALKGIGIDTYSRRRNRVLPTLPPSRPKYNPFLSRLVIMMALLLATMWMWMRMGRIASSSTSHALVHGRAGPISLHRRRAVTVTVTATMTMAVSRVRDPRRVIVARQHTRGSSAAARCCRCCCRRRCLSVPLFRVVVFDHAHPLALHLHHGPMAGLLC